MTKTLSIIIPCFNERNTISTVLDRIEKVTISNIRKEIIIVDDASTDGTRDILKKLQRDCTVLFHEHNKGKGSAIRTALGHVTGDIVIIQDADLEYNPSNYIDLIALNLENNCRVVYGSRELNKKNKRHAGWMYYIGGRLLTLMTNVLFKSNLTDMSTCYKLFDAKLLKSLHLESQGFEFCPEVTAKILRSKIKIYEVPIDYEPRKKSQGKKIRWQDGLMAVYTLLRQRFRVRYRTRWYLSIRALCRKSNQYDRGR